jgi:hypothetical protein
LYRSVQNLLSSHLLSRNPKIRLYKTLILPAALYGRETWYLTLREENRLRVFENKVLSVIFGLKSDEVMGAWRKLHNEDLHDLYSSSSLIRIIKLRMSWMGHAAQVGEKRTICRLLVGKPEKKTNH